MTPEELSAARRDRACRWVNAPDLKGYPAVPPEEETAETLAAEPPRMSEKKPKPPVEEGAP